MLRCTLVAITALIAVNISLYIITIWILTVFVNSGINVTESIFMTAITTIGVLVGIFITVLVTGYSPRRLFGSFLLIVIALPRYLHLFRAEEQAILSYRLVTIFFLYMYACFVPAAYVSELWPTHLRLGESGFMDTVGRIVAVFAPYGVAALLTRYGSVTVSIVLGVILMLCALILFCFGIETHKVPLGEISVLA